MADEPESDLPPEQDNSSASLRKELEDLRQAFSDLSSALALLEKQHSALNSYVLGFKGDGSGAEFKDNVLSLRLPTNKNQSDASFSLRIQDEGTVIAGAASTLNFVGSGVTAIAAGRLVTITIPGDTTNASNSGGGAEVLKTGTNVVGRTLTGSSGITVAQGTDSIDISLTDPYPPAYSLTIQEEGSNVETACTSINFVGETITAASASGATTVTMEELTFAFCLDGVATDYIVAAKLAE